MRFGYWIRRPRRLWARLRYWWWERRNPDKPWLTPGAVEFLDANLSPAMAALEFGSGRSTVWFAGKVGRLVSVEHHVGWHTLVKADLARRNCPDVDDPPPAYVAVAADFPDGSLDFVVVDGHYRTNCIAAVLPKLKPGGLLLVDDANLWPGDAPPVPAGWPEVHRTSNGIKVTAIWRKPEA